MSTAITGGLWRGRKLFTPEGKATRPTSAKVRQALFNIIGHDLSGLRVLDLYAGSGAVGLEALSRGAQELTLVENARPALDAIQKNLKLLGAEARVVPEDALRFASRGSGFKYDLIFVDPPFVQAYPAELPWWDLLAQDGIAIFQYPTLQGANWPRIPDRTYAYGESSLALFENLDS